MIAKSAKGKGFRQALEYDLSKEGSRVIDSNMAGETPQELAAEYDKIRKVRPTLKKPALHVSLSVAPGEKLTDEQWREIAKRYRDGMGLDKNQFVVTRHTNTEHEHIHMLANRIQFDGRVTSDSWDYMRQQTVTRELERDFGLQRVASSHEVGRKAPTRGEIELCLHTGRPSVRQQLQQLCDAAAKGSSSFTEYQERLEAAGVELVPVVQTEGAGLSGLCYRLDGETMKGSDLGRDYSPKGLAKRGVTYEHDRDFAAVRRSHERDAGRAFGGEDRGSEAGQTPERGGVSLDVGAAGAGAGRTDRRDAADLDRDRAKEPGAGRGVQAPDRRIGQELEGGSSGGAASSREHVPGRGADRVASLRLDRGDGIGHGDARERILALAGSAGHLEQRTGHAIGSPAAEAGHNRGVETIQTELAELSRPPALPPAKTPEQWESALEKLQGEKQRELTELEKRLTNDPQRRLDAMRALCPHYETNLSAKRKVDAQLAKWGEEAKAVRQQAAEHGWQLDSKMPGFLKSQERKEWELKAKDSRDERRLLFELKKRVDHEAEKDRQACAGLDASICAHEPAYRKLRRELDLIVGKLFEIQGEKREIVISGELPRDRGLELQR